MTASTAATDELSGFDGDESSAGYRAALAYAEHGWPILPGSAWTGHRHVIPGSYRVTNGPRPVVARNLATSDVQAVTRWWTADTRLEPSVLLRSGETFNLVSVAFDLAQAVIPVMEERRQAGPVLYRPDEGRAYFLVQCGVVLSVKYGRPGEVVVLPPGQWVVAPPTQTGKTANVRWWIAPESVDWCPAGVKALGDALAIVCRTRAPQSRQPAPPDQAANVPALPPETVPGADLPERSAHKP